MFYQESTHPWQGLIFHMRKDHMVCEYLTEQSDPNASNVWFQETIQLLQQLAYICI